MVVGGTYGLSLPLWGFLCDSKLSKNSPKYVEVIGAVLIAGGFLILGKKRISQLCFTYLYLYFFPKFFDVVASFTSEQLIYRDKLLNM